MKLINKLNGRLARKHSKGGFSLVELLVVIAVIGILAAIAIPALSNVFESSRQAKAKRNAQNIASTYAAARAAGTSVTALIGGAGSSIENIVTNLSAGVTGQGSFSGTTFRLNLSQTQVADADDWLTFDTASNTLVYNGTEEGTPTP